MVQPCKNKASKNLSAIIQWSTPNNLINMKLFTIFVLIQKKKETDQWNQVSCRFLSWSPEDRSMGNLCCIFHIVSTHKNPHVMKCFQDQGQRNVGGTEEVFPCSSLISYDFISFLGFVKHVAINTPFYQVKTQEVSSGNSITLYMQY